MALPTSGPLSFTDIAGELSFSSPYSLRGMSAQANFSTPDAVSDFYGYDTGGGGGGLIQFWITDPNYKNPYDVCFSECALPAWHTGLLPTPGIGDTVYTDSDGLEPLGPGYYGYSEEKFGAAKLIMDIVKGGAVLDLYQC